MTTYTLDTLITSTQGTTVAGDDATVFTRDYDVSVPVDFSLLFTEATYVQNASDPNLYDIVLTVDGTYLQTQLTNAVEQLKLTDGAAAIGASPTASSIGQRLLEMAALALFNHAGARAAITNDTDFIGLTGTLSTDVSNAFTTNKNKIFEQYANAGKLTGAEDVTTPVTMSFGAGDNFLAKITLNSTVSTSGTTTSSTYPASYSKSLQLTMIQTV
jgi:hypothetical protein